MVVGHCIHYTADKLFAEEPYEVQVTEREEKTPAYQKHEAACSNSDNLPAGRDRDFVELLVCYPR